MFFTLYTVYVIHIVITKAELYLVLLSFTNISNTSC